MKKQHCSKCWEGVVDTQQLDDLSETINNFEFEQALVKLKEIAQLRQRNGNS